MAGSSGLSAQIKAYLEDPRTGIDAEEIAARGVSGLPVLGEFLREDLPIDRTERLEAALKAILRNALSGPVSGRDARAAARFQQKLGFILKYKPYAIKAATPLGYSIFLQSEREGFSFQRHIVHKLEVFHILSVKPGGYVFLCGSGEWDRVYEARAFERWLAGEPDPAYDRWKFVPQPGDVFVISELGVVHTVVGCVLEEYATVSTDMVERLHDQNAGRTIPAGFNRGHAEAALKNLSAPPRSRLVSGLERRSFQALDAAPVQGGREIVLCDSFVRAARYTIDGGMETAVARDERRAISLRIFSGQGSILMADDSELGSAAPRLEFCPADVLLIPPGIYYSLRNEGAGRLEYSEHRIEPGIAFV